MSSLFYTQAPSNAGHDHFASENIDSFPDLHAHSTFEDRGKFIRDSLRYQLVTVKADWVQKRIPFHMQTSTCESALSFKGAAKSNFA